MAFVIGSVVILKSGGPIMTVTNVGTDARDNQAQIVGCTWFDKDGREQTGTYPGAALEAYEGEPTDSVSSGAEDDY
jgi:uncharacterized protein YodC (DUF2158 family)